jgi:hypothetical protein
LALFGEHAASFERDLVSDFNDASEIFFRARRKQRNVMQSSEGIEGVRHALNGTHVFVQECTNTR